MASMLGWGRGRLGALWLSARTSPTVWLGLVSAAIGVLLFAQVMGLTIVSPKAAVWENPPNDMAAGFAGYQALLGDPWSFPPTVTRRLVAPYPVAIIYSDSNPWLSLVLKASGLGEQVNPLGLFWLISYMLQPVAMILLLRAAGVRRQVSLFLGAMLALLFPAWIARQFGHAALSGHWVLLLALALSVRTAREGLTPGRIAGFAGLGALATGLHAYHLIPVGVCFGAALVSEVLQGRPGGLRRGLLASAVFILSVGLSAFVLGYGVGQGESDGGAILGLHSMNLAAPFMPQASAVFGQIFDGGWFTGTVDPTGGQAFEGYNYLGAGIIFLMAAAAALTAATCRRRAFHLGPWARRYGPLAAGMAALTVMAIGPKVYFADHLLFAVPSPSGRIGDVIALFRSHGRFFWTVGYILLAGAVILVDRRAGRRLLIGLGVAALALQAFDVNQLQAGVRSKFIYPARSTYPPALAQATAIDGRAWLFYPTYYCTGDERDRLAIGQLSVLALRHDGSSNSSPIARRPDLECGIPDDALRTAPPNDRRITVVLNHGEPYGPVVAGFAGRSDCNRFQQGLICGAGLDRIPGLEPAPGAALATPWRVDDATYLFAGAKSPMLGDGWSVPGEQAIWSEGAASWILIPPPDAPDLKLVAIRVEGLSYTPPGKQAQTIGVSVDGVPLTAWTVSPETWTTHVVIVPGEMVRKGVPLKLKLSIPGAASPGPHDPRLLGFGLKKITVSH